MNKVVNGPAEVESQLGNSRLHHTTKILLAAAPVGALMPAPMPGIPIRQVVAALHRMLRQRIQCVRPPNVGRGYFPGPCEVLRGVPRNQAVGANYT